MSCISRNDRDDKDRHGTSSHRKISYLIGARAIANGGNRGESNDRRILIKNSLFASLGDDDVDDANHYLSTASSNHSRQARRKKPKSRQQHMLSTGNSSNSNLNASFSGGSLSISLSNHGKRSFLKRQKSEGALKGSRASSLGKSSNNNLNASFSGGSFCNHSRSSVLNSQNSAGTLKGMRESLSSRGGGGLVGSGSSHSRRTNKPQRHKSVDSGTTRTSTGTSLSSRGSSSHSRMSSLSDGGSSSHSRSGMNKFRGRKKKNDFNNSQDSLNTSVSNRTQQRTLNISKRLAKVTDTFSDDTKKTLLEANYILRASSHHSLDFNDSDDDDGDSSIAISDFGEDGDDDDDDDDQSIVTTLGASTTSIFKMGLSFIENVYDSTV